IARDVEDLRPAVAQCGKRGKRPEAASRNHRLPLEPEVEQVAVDYQGRNFSGNPRQIPFERAFDSGVRDSQMQVGNDVAWSVEHATSLAQRRYLNKCSR